MNAERHTMPPRAHPSQITLARLATGELAAGPALVAATHVALCAQCRSDLRACEALGGAALHRESPAVLSASAARVRNDPDAFRHAAPTPQPARKRPGLAPGVAWPPPLAAVDVGRWRFIAPGVRGAFVDLPAPGKAIVLRVGGGASLPRHGHRGIEYTCVLSGSFDDQGQRIARGDMVECDSGIEHRPVADAQDGCVCVLAVDGRLAMRSWLALLSQRVLGF